MLVIPLPVREDIVTHARAGYPEEVCGLLVGKTHGLALTDIREVITAVRARNIESVRRNDRYQIHPDDMAAGFDLAHKQGLDVVGFYHSHPDHPARASQTDLENSSPWGGYSYPIVSIVKGQVADFRSWYRQDDAWVEEKIEGGK